MVYNNHFVVCVLVDGKPQKERKDGIIVVPYGAEYYLRFRNKHSRRAVVRFTIDNEDVSGPGYIVPAHSAIDIHRHHLKDARFKFVSLDSPEAVDYGKTDNTDGSKGVIEAKFFLETQPLPSPWWTEHHHHHHHHWPVPTNPPWPKPNPYNPIWLGANSGQYRATSSGGGTYTSTGQMMPTMNYSKEAAASVPFENAPPLGSVKFGEGCTVDGGSSGQTFGQQCISLESDFVTIRLVLRGADAPVAQAVTEEYCTGCGAKRLRKSDRFCGACGHRL